MRDVWSPTQHAPVEGYEAICANFRWQVPRVSAAAPTRWSKATVQRSKIQGSKVDGRASICSTGSRQAEGVIGCTATVRHRRQQIYAAETVLDQRHRYTFFGGAGVHSGVRRG